MLERLRLPEGEPVCVTLDFDLCRERLEGSKYHAQDIAVRVLSLHQLRPGNAQMSNHESQILQGLCTSYKSVEIGQTLTLSSGDTQYKLHIEAINDRREQHGPSTRYSVT